MGTSTSQAWLARGAPLLVFALVLLVQLPLLRNPGYFSHDELQWAAFAGDHGPIPWVSWIGVDAFQYRPLTFNLWLALSRLLFAHPQAFHAVLVAWGAANTALCCALARRLGVAVGPAIVGALVFGLGPFAAYVHGWVGTIAELAWVSCALVVGLCVRDARPAAAAGIAALLTATALLAKEAAMSIPALLALAWWIDGRRRSWGAAALGAGTVALAYLALRVDALLHAPREGAQYVLQARNMPVRWLEFQLFPTIPATFEIATTFATGVSGRVVAAALLWLALLAALRRSDRRLATAFLLGGVAALAPVLPLGSSGDHYGYAFAALTACVAAAAWPHAPRWGRGILSLVAVLCVWHGVNVMRQLRHVGDVQAVFSPALADVLRDRSDRVRLQVTAPGDAWIFARLTHEIPRYDGVVIGDRTRLVAAGTPADYAIRADGRLSPLR